MYRHLPESPTKTHILDEHNSTEASSSRVNDRTAITPSLVHPSPRFLLEPTISGISTLLKREMDAARSGKSNNVRPTVILRHSIQWAVEHCDVELVVWLAALLGRWATILDEVVAELEDEDGWGLVGMAIQSSCGRHDKEEIVRTVVTRWGLDIGPRNGHDRSGWTPLHLAALVSTPPLVSFLLNRGASSTAITHRGLTAYDLITGMEGRENLAILLDPFGSNEGAGVPSPNLLLNSSPTLSESRRSMLVRRRQRSARRLQRTEQRERRRLIAQERERWVRERARVIGADTSVLFPVIEKPRRSFDSGLDDLDEDSDDEESSDLGGDVFITGCSMLVFSPFQLPDIYEIIISSYLPQCQPLAKRALPANVLYLYARFAHYRCDEVWLEELLEGAMEKIERGVFDNDGNLTYLAFWEYNLTLLLYLLRSDEQLCQACCELHLLNMIEELINAIHVFVIRNTERKIDSILNEAILDSESLEDFDDVRFEDQWSLFRSFGAKKKRETVLPEGQSTFSNSQMGSAGDSVDSPWLQRSLREGPKLTSKLRTLDRPQSIQDFRGAALAATTVSKDIIANGLASTQAALSDKPSPRKVTEVLSGVLLILQLYDVNPAFTTQLFSQVFYWIACEIFNRILTRHKYLSRSKAVQIRMNLTALEDWTRANGLPPQIITKHFEPAMQLLQWLQCLSQIREFDMLIGTVQSFKSLNPLQMRRAVRDYRYEVGESRMADDCLQYLAQLQKDWERRRIQMEVISIQGNKNSLTSPELSTTIDALFDGDVALSVFVPQCAPECMGELLDSRFMLPFIFPSQVAHLIASPPTDAAYLHLVSDSPLLLNSGDSSRPLSRASYTSSRPMAWTTYSERRLRQLPDDFFTWLKLRQSLVRLSWDAPEVKADRASEQGKLTSMESPSLPHILGTTDSSSIGHNLNTIKTNTTLLPLIEDQEVTPLAPMSRYYKIGLDDDKPPAMSTDTSSRQWQLDTPYVSTEPLPKKVSFDSPATVPMSQVTAENYELKLRAASMTESPQKMRVSLGSPTPAPHYELARHRRERESSASSISAPQHSPTSSLNTEKTKWWKLNRRSGSSDGGDTSPPSPRRRANVSSDEERTPASEAKGTLLWAM